jgi:hypothetical protein
VGMQQANANIGELWVSYDIEFHKAQNCSSLSNHFAAYITDYTNALPLGTATALQHVSDFSMSYIKVRDGDKIILDKKNAFFFISIMWKGTATSITYPSIALNNCVLAHLSKDIGDGQNQPCTDVSGTVTAPSAGVNTPRCVQQVMVKTNNTGLANVAFGNSGVLPTATRSLYIVVHEINDFQHPI